MSKLIKSKSSSSDIHIKSTSISSFDSEEVDKNMKNKNKPTSRISKLVNLTNISNSKMNNFEEEQENTFIIRNHYQVEHHYPKKAQKQNTFLRIFFFFPLCLINSIVITDDCLFNLNLKIKNDYLIGETKLDIDSNLSVDHLKSKIILILENKLNSFTQNQSEESYSVNKELNFSFRESKKSGLPDYDVPSKRFIIYIYIYLYFSSFK